MSEGYRRISMLVLGWALCLCAAGGAESSSDCVHARFRIADQWPSGYCVYVILENRTQQTVYNLGLQFRTTATINNSWVGDYHQSGGVVTVTFPGFAAALAPGRTHTESGFCAHGELPSDLVVLSGGVPLEPCNGCVIASLVAPPGDVNGDGYLDRCEGCLIGAIGCDESVIHALDHMSCTFADEGEAPAIALYRFDLARDTAGIDITLCGTDGVLTAQLILYDVRGEELDRSTYCASDPFCACLEDLPLPAGTYYVAATTPYTMEYGAYELSIACRGAVQEERFRRGDVNADGAMNIADAVALLGSLFAGADAPSCLDAADANDDGTVNIADAIAILAYLFADGPALPAPFAECGVDPTEDALGCDVFPPCGTGT